MSIIAALVATNYLAMKAKRLTPVMQQCIDSLKQHGKLVRWSGGYWTRPGCEVRTIWNEVKIPDWHYTGNTINALIERGIIIATDLNMNTATGQYFPVEVKLKEWVTEIKDK